MKCTPFFTTIKKSKDANLHHAREDNQHTCRPKLLQVAQQAQQSESWQQSSVALNSWQVRSESVWKLNWIVSAIMSRWCASGLTWNALVIMLHVSQVRAQGYCW
jgi:hypothetical protein